MAEPQVVKFAFQVRQVKTMADRSVNVILNLPEYAYDAAAEIMKRIDSAGEGALVFEPVNLTKLDETGKKIDKDETEKGAEKPTIRVGRRRS